MCGILGFFLLNNFKPTKFPLLDRKKFIHLGLYIDIIRGEDGTGVGISNTNFNKFMVEKRDLPSFIFLETKSFDNIDRNLLDSPFAIAHNRAATRGKKAYENTHPFIHGNILLAHNGTLSSYITTGKNFDTDSETICYGISKQGISYLKGITGPTSLVWADKSDKSINFCRNEGRPMHIAYGEGFLVYASDEDILDFLIRKCDIELDNSHKYNFFSTKENYLIKFYHEEEKIKPKVSKLKIKESSFYQSKNKYSYYYNEKDNNAKKRLEKAGLKYDQYVKFHINGFDGNQCCVFGNNKDYPGIIFKHTFVTHENYKKFNKEYRRSKDKNVEYIGKLTYSVVKNGVLYAILTNISKVNEANKNNGKDNLPAILTTNRTEDREVPGPNGTPMPYKKFLALTRGRCGLCDNFIMYSDVADCEWTRDGQAIVCPECLEELDKEEIREFL